MNCMNLPPQLQRCAQEEQLYSCPRFVIQKSLVFLTSSSMIGGSSIWTIRANDCANIWRRNGYLLRTRWDRPCCSFGFLNVLVVSHVTKFSHSHQPQHLEIRLSKVQVSSGYGIGYLDRITLTKMSLSSFAVIGIIRSLTMCCASAKVARRFSGQGNFYRCTSCANWKYI